MSTVKFLLDVFDQSSDQIAIVNKIESITYGELSLSVKSRIEWLSDNGVRKGEVIILLGDYSLDSVSLLLALTELGCILAPLTPAVSSPCPQRA